MNKLIIILLSCIVSIFFHSCSIDEDITTALPPKIILDNETGIYTVKQGRKIVIAPKYQSAEGATYLWTMEGEVLGTSPSLLFMKEEIGEYYIKIAVRNESGIDEKEIRIDVVDLEIPVFSIACKKNVTIALGSELELRASLRSTSLPTEFMWSVNGNKVSEEVSYTFYPDVIGLYTIVATASNDDGIHSETINVNVLNAEDLPFVWDFGDYELHTTEDRKLLIKPLAISDVGDIEYTWFNEQKEVLGSDTQFVFLSDNQGNYIITAEARRDGSLLCSHTFNITVYEERAYYRSPTAVSKTYWNKVFEYTPAPGQFINELKTGGFDSFHTTPEAAVTYAESRMGNANWVSLGGFGGFLTVGFDHSIDNSGDYDLGVIGNAFDGSSEPGIVWVMQDENGNGLPDDTWYELAGSESNEAGTIRNYSVTYYRPSASAMPVQWSDNLGNFGEIDYLKQFHTQDSYYPMWINEESYTLSGTRLEPRNYDNSGDGSYWVQPHYDWGYADNFSPFDYSSSDKANLFKISNAIDFEGVPVNLSHIDFVKVQCAVNAKSGWLGEISTEVCGFYDYNLSK